MRMIPARSKHKPIQIIFLMGIFPVPKAMVLAAVATGKANPREAAKVAGSNKDVAESPS